MLKRVNQRAKRTIFLVWMTSFLILTCLAIYVLYPYISGYLVLNTFPFLSTGKPTFYGENIDMSQILPTSQHYVVNSKGEDLIDIAANLGINIIRITNVRRSFKNHADSVYTRDQWDRVLSKMQRKGIKALILIEVVSDNGDYYTPDIRPAYLHLVQEYIDSGVFSHPDVYAVDIKNEPILTDANISMLQAAHTMIKARYPYLKQTIGSWATYQSPSDASKPNPVLHWSDYSAGQKIADIVDFYSVHMYGLDLDIHGIKNPSLETKVILSQVEKGLQTTKPIFITEFGAANGYAISDQDTIDSPELQAKVYQGVYQALKEMHSSQLIGAMAFDFYSRKQYPDAWAIVKNNGDYLLPAAYILQEYALGKENSSLQVATVVNSQSYLVTNTNNNAMKNLHISDRIGIKLQLDTNNDYAVYLSKGGILRTIEDFNYEKETDSYYALYQAVSKGSIQIYIISNNKCNIGDICTSPVYTLRINIQ